MKQYYIQITPETISEVRHLIEQLGYKSDEPWNRNTSQFAYKYIKTYYCGEYNIFYYRVGVSNNYEPITIEQLRKLTREDVV